MYLWIGINLDEQLFELRIEVEKASSELNLINYASYLPIHISLRSQFFVNDADYNRVIEDIISIYKDVIPFEVKLKRIENLGFLVWIVMEENDQLELIHKNLFEILREKYGILADKIDFEYKFHSTLIYPNDESKTNLCFDKLKDIDIPEKITGNKFVIGYSEDNSLGSYRVIKEIKI